MGGAVYGSFGRARRGIREGRSWDGEVGIEHRHHLRQRPAHQGLAPEGPEVRHPRPIREAACEMEGEHGATPCKPVAPAPHGVAAHPSHPRRGPHRARHGQGAQGLLLNAPVIPAPGCHAGGQTRAGGATPGATETVHRSRFVRAAMGRAAGLAVVPTVAPERAEPAPRAAVRAVARRIARQSVMVLGE